jgi:predicted O-linked N-acetylglucosamine transferase (SPINDLY family)
MTHQNIKDLRQRMSRCYAEGAYRQAAEYMHRLEVLGDRSPGWWEYALMLAGALGDAAIVDVSIRVLAQDRTRLRRALKAAWSKAVSGNHRDLAKQLARRLWQIAPDDTDFRVLNLLDALASGTRANTTLSQLTAEPLPLASMDPELLRVLICALHKANFGDDARRLLDRLLALHPPAESSAREQTALLAEQLKRYTVAMTLTEDRAEPRLRYVRSLICLQTLAWDELRRTQLSSAELHALLEHDGAWVPSMLWRTLMLPGYVNADHLALARRATAAMGAAPPETQIRPSERPTRLRVGYMSGDFRVHPCNQLLCPVLEAHDKSRFELIAFDNSRDDASAVRQRILAAFDTVITVRNLSTELLAQAIRVAGIDILVDLSGHTTDNRLDGLARRPARIQMTWLGFPGGVGGGLADYLIVDGVSVPEGLERDFDEALIRLPVSYLPGGECPTAILPPARLSQGLPVEALVFACFNQQAKISCDTFAGWCEILLAVPESILWLADEGEASRTRLMSAAAMGGISPSRLRWAARTQAHSAHIQRVACADLILDTQPFTMHTTAVDALAAGVPFLAFCGETVASRVSSSLLHTAGLGDCVCENAEDYVRRMVALARNEPERMRLRKRFQEARTESPLFDSRSFARYFETAYDVAYARWLDGEAPADITVERVLPGGST